MPFNGSGVFTPYTPGNPVVTGTVISSTVNNNTNTDIATGLSTAILKDGTQTVTANIPFGGFKATGLAQGTARTDAGTIADAQDGTGTYAATVGGTADVITLTPTPAIAAYVAGQRFSFIASGANTTNVTVAVSGLTAKAITKQGATALSSGDIASGAVVLIEYDGTRFQLQNASVLGTGATVSMQSFVVTGTYTPTAGMKYCIVHMVGGAAGGATLSSGNFGGGGGGAGEYATGVFSAATIGASKAITIGAAGAAGGAGGTTSMTTLLTAVGGSAGASGFGGVGGTGGTGTGLHIQGGTGAGGGSATTAPQANGGQGGASFFGSGGYGGQGGGSNGAAGISYGSGGGGNGFLGSWSTGGVGAVGCVVIYEYQ